jgi:hypothetical protein
LLVLTGVTDAERAILAPPGQRPTYISADLTGLLEPHPAVTAAGAGFRCAGWTASWAGDRLELDGDGIRIDAVRVLCAAAWSRDAPSSPEMASHDTISAALTRLG